MSSIGDADFVAHLLRAKDGDDVAVLDAREHLPFAEHFGAMRGILRFDDLDRDLAGECVVPGAIDAPEATMADLVEEAKVAPLAVARPVGQRAGARLDRLGLAGIGVVRARSPAIAHGDASRLSDRRLPRSPDILRR